MQVDGRSSHIAEAASGAVSAGSNPVMTPPLLGNLGGVRFWERNGSGQPRACVARCGQLDRLQCSDQRI